MIRSAFFRGFAATDAELLQTAAQILDVPPAELGLRHSDGAVIVQMRKMTMMKNGMLIYDGDGKRSLERKVALAAVRYHRKFGKPPNICHVNPEDWGKALAKLDLDGESLRVGTVTVKPNPAISHGYFQLGQKDSEETDE